MSITPAQYEVKIYIEPDDGPIKPLKLNMLEMEEGVIDLGSSSNRDQVRMQRTIERIKDAFPGIDPYGNLDMIRHFVRRFNHVALFNGVVLRLPGTIQADSKNIALDPDSIKNLEKEYQTLKSESEALKGNVQYLEKKYQEEAKKNPELEKQVKQYVIKFEELERRIKHLQEECDTAREEKDKAVDDAQRVRARESTLEQENASLMLKEEQARRDLRAYNVMQNELADLRVENDNLRKENVELHTTLDKCEQENIKLREQQRRKAEPKLPPDPVNPDPDQAKKTWIDN
jgi:peptidoglycan hydrolase CwlO-like protein